MKSQVIKRSVVIAGHKTSISIEDAFWHALKEIANERGIRLSGLIGLIKAARPQGSNLSSAVRVYVLQQLRARLRALLNVPTFPPRSEERPTREQTARDQ